MNRIPRMLSRDIRNRNLAMKTNKQTWKARVGTFSKALPGAVSLNFSESGGSNCSPRCKLLNAGCYAQHTELMKPSISVSGERKRKQGFANTCRQLTVSLMRESRKRKIPWVRLSSFGSVPNRLLGSHEVKAFVSLLKAVPEETPIHFPVETPGKAAQFRRLCNASGREIVVRESSQTEARAVNAIRDGGQVSLVVGGGTKKENLAKAKTVAARLREKTGERAAICPAIASTINRRKPVKCGQCTLCADKGCAAIVYPQH